MTGPSQKVAYLDFTTQLGMFTIATRSTAWAFSQRTYTRLPICKSSNGMTNGHNRSSAIKHGVCISAAMWNAWDLIANLRGVGWDGPPKMHIAKPYFQVESRLVFFLLSLGRAVLMALVSDCLSRYIHSFGPDTFGTPKGGTIFDHTLPPLERYTKSSIVTFLSGLCAYLVIEQVYQMHAALFTALFQQHPSQWPPLFDSPWLSTSLTSFWGRRWHQVFREPFVMVGSKPMERYFGRVGATFGAFAVSGVLHDVGMRGMGRGGDTLPNLGFFLLHGAAVILEHAWKRITGRPVGGIPGFLWVYLAFVLSGQVVVDVWARRGMLASEFYPEAYRPSTLLLNLISK